MLLQLFHASRRFNVEIQPQLVLLQKTLLNIEGLGRQLDPELDLWATAKPYLERWMNEQIGPPALQAAPARRGAVHRRRAARAAAAHPPVAARAPDAVRRGDCASSPRRSARATGWLAVVALLLALVAGLLYWHPL